MQANITPMWIIHGTYKSNGTYNNALSELVSKKVDEEV